MTNSSQLSPKSTTLITFGALLKEAIWDVNDSRKDVLY